MHPNCVRAPRLLLYQRHRNVARVARAIAPSHFYACEFRNLSELLRIATSFKLPLVLTGPEIGLVIEIRNRWPLAFIGVVANASTRRREFLEAGADIYCELADSGEEHSVTLAANAVREAVDYSVRYIECMLINLDEAALDPAELRRMQDNLLGQRWKRDSEWAKEVGSGAFAVSNGRIIGPAASADQLIWDFRAENPDADLIVFRFDERIG